MNIKEIRKTVDGIKQDYNTAHQQVKAEKTALKEVRTELRDTKEAQRILQEAAQNVQQRVHEKVSEIVSRCLQAVFDEPYEFQIVFDQKRGKTEARMVFIRDGQEVDPKRASGGGVIDVTAFALRLACLLLTRPQPRRILVLDEPFRFLSRDYRPRVRALLESLSEELEVQIIMVTHDPMLTTGKVIEI